MDVEVKQSVLRGDVAGDMRRSGMDDTEAVDVYMCMAARRSYPCITCHEEVRQRDRLTVEEQGDRRAGRIAVETLVRDRLAYPCFLLLLCCP